MIIERRPPITILGNGMDDSDQQLIQKRYLLQKSKSLSETGYIRNLAFVSKSLS